jgi:reductive dehalogenase
MSPNIIVLCIIAGAGLMLFLPFKGARSYNYTRPVKRIHEADVVLSRRFLAPGSEAYEAYYQVHPEFRPADDRSRSAPGLLDKNAHYFQTGTFAAARANFKVVEFMGGLIHGPGAVPENTAGQKAAAVNVNPERTSRFISRWLIKTGAHSVGFTPLEEYHLYSHKGRGSRSGTPIIKKHKNAIAITVEMDRRMMQSSPRGTSVMESSEQYLRSGVLALKLAAWIRELGYEATAHIDGNYEVICPLVAVDAGLGSIGRMGLLMTPRLGPRVRISVVTTDIPVSLSRRIPDRTTLQFCHLCHKCARVCPSNAIPHGPRAFIDGTERWQISSEKCYHYWTTSGTDCGRCIAACPYSHQDSPFHRFIRWGIKNNLFFRRLAIKLDVLFYGRNPTIRPLPDWTDILEK